MRSPAKINKAIFFLALWMIAINLIAGLLAEIMGWGMIIGTGIFQVVGIFVPFVFYLLVTKQSHHRVLAWKRLSLNNALIVAAITLAIQPMLQIIFRLASFIFTPVITDFLELVETTPVWLSFLIIAILPSFFEEFWFRGAMYTKYREGGVSIRKTAIITGIFFGLMHMNFHQAVYAAVIGILLAYILYYTRSIWSVILAHFINNGIHALLMYSSSYRGWMEGFDDRAGMFFLVMGIASLVMLPVVVLCIRQLVKYHAATEEPEVVQKPQDSQEPQQLIESNAESAATADIKEKVYTWGFWAALAIFVIIALLIEVALRIM